MLRARDKAWSDQVRQRMQANYQGNADRLLSRQAAGAPAQLLQKALNAMTSVDVTQDAFKRDPTVRELLKRITDIAALYMTPHKGKSKGRKI